MRDTDYALVKLRGLLGGSDPDRIVYVVHDGAPVSKARARWNRKQARFYTPSETQAAERDLAWRFVEAVKDRPWKGNIAIVAIFFRPNRQRIDADNLMKLVMDAATTAGVWGDDCQVTAQASFIELDAERPRTIVALAPADSSMDRHVLPRRQCEHCHKEFETTRWRPRRFCSLACSVAHQHVDATCAKCGTVFRRRRAGQRYCSKQCADACPLRRQKREEQRPWPKCRTCGARVSRREYLQCSACAPRGRKRGSKNKPKEINAEVTT